MDAMTARELGQHAVRLDRIEEADRERERWRGGVDVRLGSVEEDLDGVATVARRAEGMAEAAERRRVDETEGRRWLVPLLLSLPGTLVALGLLVDRWAG